MSAYEDRFLAPPTWRDDEPVTDTAPLSEYVIAVPSGALVGLIAGWVATSAYKVSRFPAGMDPVVENRILAGSAVAGAALGLLTTALQR
jgi:hypothetical protein